MFKKICIIGCGLIGSSLARAIKKYNLSEKIVSSNRSDIVNKKVLELKMVNDSSSDTQKMAKDSDLIIIATPLSSYENVILKIKNSLKSGTILTDVGSVKERVISLVEKVFPKMFHGFHLTRLLVQKKVVLNLDFRNFSKIDGVFLPQAKKQKRKILIHSNHFGKK